MNYRAILSVLTLVFPFLILRFFFIYIIHSSRYLPDNDQNATHIRVKKLNCSNNCYFSNSFVLHIFIFGHLGNENIYLLRNNFYRIER